MILIKYLCNRAINRLYVSNSSKNRLMSGCHWWVRTKERIKRIRENIRRNPQLSANKMSEILRRCLIEFYNTFLFVINDYSAYKVQLTIGQVWLVFKYKVEAIIINWYIFNKQSCIIKLCETANEFSIQKSDIWDGMRKVFAEELQIIMQRLSYWNSWLYSI